MIPNDDHKRLFLDMQEHPEKYSDQQLEDMMDELDRDLDATAAWQRFANSTSSFKSNRRSQTWFATAIFRKAAIIVGVLFLTGIAIAAWRATRQTTVSSPTANAIVHESDVAPSPTVVATTFDNVPLDSILGVVAVHYGKAVSFRDNSLRSLKLIMKWEPDAPLADFLDRLNAFDGLSLSLLGDTIVVQPSANSTER